MSPAEVIIKFLAINPIALIPIKLFADSMPTILTIITSTEVITVFLAIILIAIEPIM